MKPVIRLALTAALGVGTIVATIAPASAQGTPCTTFYGTSQVQACATVNNGTAGATLQAYSGGFYNYTLAVEECRTDLTNCITFSATSNSTFGNYSYAAIPNKTCALGHVYRVHASWNDYYSGQRFVDARSAWTTC